jgi:hypothetical protein
VAKGQSIEQMAERATGTLTARDQEARNMKIVRARLLGLTEKEVAAKFELSEKTISNIMAKYRKSQPRLRRHDPMQIVDDFIDAYHADASFLAEVQMEAQEKGNLNAAVGATNAKTQIRQRLQELLQAVGVMPNDLGTLHLVEDGRVMGERLMSWAKRAGLDVEQMRELLDELGGPIELDDADVVDDDDPPQIAA